MISRQGISAALCLCCLVATAGCALLGKSKPLALRYFDLESNAAYQPSLQPASSRLRLGTVSASRYIDKRFVSRRSAHELTYYEEWRWSDQPDAFLRRMLQHDLFERAHLTRVVAGLAPTLEVELTAFEELKTSAGHKARVCALARMHDDRVQAWQRTFEVETEIGAGDAAEALAEALGRALSQVAAQVTDEVLQTLSRAEAAPSPPAPSPTP